MDRRANILLERDSGSFRDPSGFIFRQSGQLYRYVSPGYGRTFDLLIGSGLYQELSASCLMISHDEVDKRSLGAASAYKVLRPRRVNFVSYPYEWCFSQLKDAALTVLKIQKIALGYNLVLKDSSAYNIQFVDGRPVLIDTLSFQPYEEGKPWIAYMQFCQHFLAPLALMSLVDIRLGQLTRTFLDGIPLELASTLLPTFNLNFGLLLHLRLHWFAQRHYSNDSLAKAARQRKFSKQSFYGLIESLKKSVERLTWTKHDRDWGNYYSDGQVRPGYIHEKELLVERCLALANPSGIWDIGANTGLFSRSAARRGIPTISLDSDFSCVEKSYLEARGKKENTILPLYVDITNPSPAMGWEHTERKSLVDRGPTDLVMALALLHHLAISNNLPFQKIASFFQRIGHWLLIEFVPKEDPMVRKLLRSREDIFQLYTKEDFESEFGRHFSIEFREDIARSVRTLYLMKRKTTAG
jgi:hypothetical protein